MRSMIALFVLLFFAGMAQGRQLSRLTMDSKVAASDLIFVGRVDRIEKVSKTPGLKEIAIVRVLQGKANNSKLKEVRFVTKGYSAESNPNCCQIGKVYLFFAKGGFPVLVERDGRVDMDIVQKDSVFSGVNGPFSTYEL